MSLFFCKFGSSATIKLTLIGLHPMEGDIVLDLDVTEVGPPFGQAELHHVPLLPPVDGDSKLEIKQIHVQKWSPDQICILISNDKKIHIFYNFVLFNIKNMVFIIDGCSFNCAHTWSKSGISICWRHLVTSKESSNPIFFSEKDLI